ncbi:uncharacterized protein B0I36DRAFT_320767 [Microdochium trichocladiopsis]|uniref:Uncharacterized protein n=1 Tax=Microdochium trichocladiopsis TaxID=1682393 RepID=A0A9P8Y973_9PEZI|nr:uncharacterized protein B0I36DRAFT_320767 [Microdochium trichocladiopsis]KAH7033095.1 hypothetical protein B0I36DRAFT_320767 [Microdochium trichocladiopsis]
MHRRERSQGINLGRKPVYLILEVNASGDLTGRNVLRGTICAIVSAGVRRGWVLFDQAEQSI